MLTDWQLLGITETQDFAAIRSAYRRRAKALHPDLAAEADAYRNHLLFIQVTKAYERLTKQPGVHPNGSAGVQPGADGTTSNLVPHRDPGYVYYKTGMKCFSRIHPSYWRNDVNNALRLPEGAKERELQKVQARTRELLTLLPKAYYYFSVVTQEYPESVWARDARDKMEQIADRTPLYEKIVQSIVGHARTAPRVNRMF